MNCAASLAALKVRQTEVAQQLGDDPLSRDKALTQLHAGIDRATRLVDQLPTLSRLDSLNNLQDVAEISLEELLQSAYGYLSSGAAGEYRRAFKQLTPMTSYVPATAATLKPVSA